jgi:MFS family permease
VNETPASGGRFGPFRNRSYVVYWLGIAVSSLGTWLTAVAGSIYVYQVTGSTFAVGVFNFASFIPIVLFSVYGGQLSDRHDRRMVTAVTHALSMAISGVLAVLTFAGAASELTLMVAMFLLNTLWALGKPSLLALVPNIVPREDLKDAVALTSLSFMAGQVAGPLVATVAITIAGAWLAFAVNALTYLAPVLAMVVLARMGLSGQEAPLDRASRGPGRSAFVYLRHNIWVPGLLAGVVVVSFAMELQRTLAPALATQTLGLPEASAGLLLFAQSVGSAISFLLFVPIRRIGWSRRSAFLGLGLQGVGVVAAAFATMLPLSMAGFFLIGLGFALTFPVLTAELQNATPDDLRGRVMSYHQIALLGHRPVTALIVGAAAAGFGLVAGTLIWLPALPVGLLAVRTAFRRLPETTTDMQVARPAGSTGSDDARVASEGAPPV